MLIVDYSSNTYLGAGGLGLTTTFIANTNGSFNGNISAAISPFANDKVDFRNIESFQNANPSISFSNTQFILPNFCRYDSKQLN